MLFYPAVLFDPDANGVHGCIVPDLLINAAGDTIDDALRNAAASMVELFGMMDHDGEPFPDPTPADEMDLRGGTLAMIGAPPPALAHIPVAAE